MYQRAVKGNFDTLGKSNLVRPSYIYTPPPQIGFHFYSKNNI